MDQEIKFIALPSGRQLEVMLEQQGYHEYDRATNKKTFSRIVERYRAQQWRIVQAQRKAAVIAAEVMRPDDFRRVKEDYRQALRQAREKFEDQAVAIFSETCTKGL